MPLRSSVVIALGLVAAATMAPISAQAAINYFDEVRVVTAYNATYATCPEGWKVVGGGFELPKDYLTTESWGRNHYYKPLSSGPYLRSWRVTVTKVTEHYSTYYDAWQSSYTTTAPARVYATCVR